MVRHGMAAPNWRSSIWGQVDLEWMELVGEPSTWHDQRDEHGHCLHQIAFEVKGMLEGAVYLSAKELSLVARGEDAARRYACIKGSVQLVAILDLRENN